MNSSATTVALVNGSDGRYMRFVSQIEPRFVGEVVELPGAGGNPTLRFSRSWVRIESPVAVAQRIAAALRFRSRASRGAQRKRGAGRS